MKTKFKLKDTYDLIDICLDPVFKAVFTRDNCESREALASLIQAVTGVEVEIVRIIANEPAIDGENDRQIRFDINCKINSGEPVNIEMTLYPDAFEPVRLEFHATKLFSGQDIKGKSKGFCDLKPSCQISFLVNRSFFKDDDLIHRFEYYDRERDVSLGGRSRIFTVELKKLGRTIGKPVGEMSMAERWAVFLRYLAEKENRVIINKILEEERGIEMAARALLRVSRNERQRARLMSEYKYITDHQSKMVHARKEGREEGREEGVQQIKADILDFINSGGTIEELRKKLSR